MAENKTKPTDASVEDYIASRASEQQRVDCRELMALLGSVTREPPRMWGPSIVGFGSYRYTYDSGRTGEALTQLQLASSLNRAFDTNLIYREMTVEEYRRERATLRVSEQMDLPSLT